MNDGMPGWPPDRVVAAEREVDVTFDLAECVREPIHRLGGVQSYGALVAIHDDAGRRTITVLSENAEAVLGITGLTGADAGRLLHPEQLGVLAGLADADTGQTAMMPVELASAAAGST